MASIDMVSEVNMVSCKQILIHFFESFVVLELCGCFLQENVVLQPTKGLSSLESRVPPSSKAHYKGFISCK